MTFVFEPALSLLIVSAILVLAGIFGLLLPRRNPARKIIGLALVLVIVGVMVSRYRTAELTVDDVGIVADTYGRPTIPWSEVEQVSFIDTLSESRYAPRPGVGSFFRVIGYGRARYGRFSAAGSDPALFAVQRVDGEAVVVTTQAGTYVLAPSDPQGLALAIAEYVPVFGVDGGLYSEPVEVQ